MIRDSLRKIVAITTMGVCANLFTTSAEAQRYGLQNNAETDYGHEISSLQQNLRANNSRLQQLEKDVVALGRKIGSSSNSSQNVSYNGGSNKYTPSGNGSIHRVERGDTLSSISRRYGVGIDRLASSNQLIDPHRLKIGQEIFIPGSKGGTSRNEPAPAPSPSNHSTPSGTGTYTVQSGDTLSSIARNHGTSIRALMQSNDLQNPDTLRIGQRLHVSGASSSSSSSEAYPSSSQGSSSSSHSTPPSPNYDEPVSSSSEVEAPEGYGWYQVVRGDTLFSIGQDFSITTNELMRLNELSSHEVQPDQYLLVPVDDESLYES